MHSLAPKPACAARRTSSVTACASSSAKVTPSTGAGSPALAACRSICMRAGYKLSQASAQPMSRARSADPKASRCSCGCEHRSPSCRMPRADSTRAMMGSATLDASMSRSALDSLLDSITPARHGPCFFSSARSSLNQAVDTALMRTQTGCSRAAPPAERKTSRASRAAPFRLASTASSRSAITACAPAAKALAMRSGRVAGTKR